jgi:hypothetical protein
MTLLVCILGLKSEFTKIYATFYEMILGHGQGDRCDLSIRCSHTFPYALYGKSIVQNMIFYMFCSPLNMKELFLECRLSVCVCVPSLHLNN